MLWTFLYVAITSQGVILWNQYSLRQKIWNKYTPRKPQYPSHDTTGNKRVVIPACVWLCTKKSGVSRCGNEEDNALLYPLNCELALTVDVCACTRERHECQLDGKEQNTDTYHYLYTYLKLWYILVWLCHSHKPVPWSLYFWRMLWWMYAVYTIIAVYDCMPQLYTTLKS